MTETSILQPGQLMRIDALPGTSVRVLRGRVWLTRYDDPRDHVLRRGEGFAVESSGPALVTPLEPSLLELYRADPHGVRVQLQREAERERTRSIWHALRRGLAALAGR